MAKQHKVESHPEIRWADCIEEFFDCTLWDKQKQIVDLLQHNRRVAVRSGHGVGKSFVAAAITLTWLMRHKESMVVTTARTWTQVKRVLWGNIHNLYNKCQFGGTLN